MKGHQQHSSPLLLPPNKRRCTALAAAVPALVVCSILLPLVFLLGLHRPGVYFSCLLFLGSRICAPLLLAPLTVLLCHWQNWL